MVDAAVLIREHLLNQAAVVVLLGSNLNGSVYAAPDLPEKFDPKLGPCVQLYRMGGHSHPEIPELLEAIVHLRIWADQEKYQQASDLYGAVHDALHGAQQITLTEGTILSAIEAMGPTELTDPDSSWAMIDATYQVMARPN